MPKHVMQNDKTWDQFSDQVVLRTPQPKKKGTKTFYSSPKTRCMSSPPYEKPPAKAKNNESSWAPPCTTNGVGSRSRPASQTCPPTPNANYNVLVTQVRDGISAVSDEKTSRAGKPRVWKRARLGGETRSSGKVIKTHFVRDFSKFWFTGSQLFACYVPQLNLIKANHWIMLRARMFLQICAELRAGVRAKAC